MTRRAFGPRRHGGGRGAPAAGLVGAGRRRRARRGRARPCRTARRSRRHDGSSAGVRGARLGAVGAAPSPRPRRPGPRRPGLARPPSSTHVHHDDGDVVAAAAVDGQVDELLGRLVGVVDRAQHAGDAALGHLVEQAVGAQHVAVAGVRIDREHVDRHLVVHAEDAGDDVALRVHRRLLGRQAALAHHLGDQAVVGRDLVELAVGVAVAARVADVGDGQHLGGLVVDDGERHHGGAHARELGVLDPRVVHRACWRSPRPRSGRRCCGGRRPGRRSRWRSRWRSRRRCGRPCRRPPPTGSRRAGRRSGPR